MPGRGGGPPMGGAGSGGGGTGGSGGGAREATAVMKFGHAFGPKRHDVRARACISGSRAAIGIMAPRALGNPWARPIRTSLRRSGYARVLLLPACGERVGGGGGLPPGVVFLY